MIDTDKIAELLKSHISQYKIHKDTGFSQGSLSDLRHGKTKIEDLTVKNATKLAKYYDEIHHA
ncbi:XRE family transcriptional regulator [Oenococcus sicerae]|uniref:XRE family transcriptional regulator n=1 Tax=Oenococcus sicerae TaxID=2203724 RepID=A0ABX5QPB7_9LACO|nr:XRE family transcriptional regulator [Oenococcus sicerae]